MSARIRLPLCLALTLAAGVASAQPTDPDLQESLPDVVLSSAIRDQAQALGSDPARIYEFVRNECAYEAYYGLMKGPEATLRSRRGNDYDLAALLVSLLRAANVPARFARGRIEVTASQATAWTGMSSAGAARQLWYYQEPPAWNGVAGIGAALNGSLVEKLQIWVEARAGVARYRGAGPQPTSGLAWVALDPSFKGSDWPSDPGVLTPATLPAGLLFNYATETAACTGTDDSPEDCGYYNVVDPRLPLEVFSDQVRRWLHDNRPDLEFEDLRFRGSVRELSPGVLPTALPYRVISSQRHSTLVDLHRPPLSPATIAGSAGGNDYRYRWQIAACSFATAGCGAQGSILTHLFPTWERPTAELEGKRVTLAFPPTAATASLVPTGGYADAACAQGGGGIQTVPTVYVNGVATALGASRPLCEALRLHVTTVAPLGSGIGQYFLRASLTSVHDDVRAGGTYVLALDAFAATPSLVRAVGTALADAHAQYPIALDASDVPCIDTNRDGVCSAEPWLGRDFTAQEALVGGLLHLAAARYYDLVGGSRTLVRQLHFHTPLRYPTTGLVLGGIRPAAFLGAPYSVLSQRLVIDVKGSWGAALGRGGSVITSAANGDLEGHQASAGEHAVWEEIAGVEAVSTVKGFQVGASKSHTLLTVTPANAASTLQSRCNGSTCSGLDIYAYCEIRNAFGTPSYASQWSCAGVAPPTVPSPQEMRINACANFEYYSWKGYVYYARSAGASSYSIIPTNQPESCGAGTTAYVPPIRESAAGGGIVANLVPYVPLVYRPEFLPSPFTILDSIIFADNSGVTNVVTAGDPVSVVTGNNQHVEVDLQIAGRAGHDLRLVRSYNSRLDYDGPLGHGWIHTFDQHLIRDAAASRVTWRDETGSEFRFDDTGGSLVAEAGVHDTLVRGADGWYTLTRKTGLVYRFQPENPAGRAHLREIRDRNGNAILCNLTGDLLVSVQDTAGRYLLFTSLAGRLTEIRDWTGRRWRYALDARGDLVEFRDPVQSAADVTLPGSGQPVRYSYWSDQADAKLAHNLKCWIRPATGAVASGVSQLCGSYPGREWIHFRYQTNDTVQSHTDSLGRTTTFAFNFFRRRSSVAHPDGSTESYIFDAKGNVVRHETARGAVRRFEYAPGTRNKVNEWDAFGNLTAAGYDGRGNVVSRSDRLGAQETWSWNGFSQPTLHVDRRGVRREWEYDAAGNLRFEYRSVDGVRSALRQHTYGSFGNRALSIENQGPAYANAGYTYFFYDTTGTALGRVVDPLGFETRFTVDGLGRRTASERSRSADGSVETVTVRTRYDADDRVDQVIDPHGTARRSFYDANGRVTQRRTVTPDQMTAPEATAGRADETLIWDARGNLRSRTNALGLTTSYEPDARDRLAAIVTPLGSREERSYDGHGNLIRIADGSGRSLDFEYDLEDRLARASDGLGRVARSEFDAEGRETRRYAPGASSAGRLVYEALALDGEGNPTRERDAAGREYRRTWDEFGRLERLEGPIGLAENAATSWTYTFQGWPRTRSDGAGHQLEVVYDRAGQPRTIFDGLDRDRQLFYDELGNRIRETDTVGASMIYRYDARGLLLQRSGAGVDDRYGYDDYARRVTAANAVSAHRFRYDALDRMVEHEGSLMGTAHFGYDADGRLAHVAYPKTPGSSFAGESAVVTYQYDEAGRVVSIHDSELTGLAGVGVDGAFQFGWDAVGRLAERSDPNDTTRSTRFTPEGWVDAIEFSARGTATGAIDYRSYDALGNPGVVEYPGGLVTDPAYDARSRVTQATHTSLALETFDYDAAGNRTRHWSGGDNRRYDLDAADQLTRTRRIASGGVETQTVLERFLYDTSGRRTLWEELNEATGAVTRSTAYDYDGLGRLTRVDFDTAGTASDYAIDLEYGPLGERIRRSKTQGGVVDESLYLGGLVELRGILGGGAPHKQVRVIAGPGPGGVVAEVTNVPATGASGLFSVVGDAAGNAVRAIEVGELTGLPFVTTQVQRFRSFGEPAAGSGPALIERGFAARVAEGPSGLLEMGARHYDPVHGRFLQPDPIGIATDQPYAYAANNPFLYVDPRGLSPVRISGDGAIDVFVRSFAPFESFGGGFEGDDRTFSTDVGATSRISGQITIDSGTGDVLAASASSSPTRCVGPPCSTFFGSSVAVANPTISVTRSNGSIVTHLAGANPLVSFAPSIDLTLTLQVGANGALSGSLVGDAFPNAEVFVAGPAGSQMLLTFGTSGGPLTGPLLLFGPGTRPMGSFSCDGRGC